MFSKLVLRCVDRSGKAAPNLGQVIRHRLRKWRAGAHEALYDQAVRMLDRDRARSNNTALKRAKSMVAKGLMARACKALDAATMLEPNARVIDALRALHPEAAEPAGADPPLAADHHRRECARCAEIVPKGFSPRSIRHAHRALALRR